MRKSVFLSLLLPLALVSCGKGDKQAEPTFDGSVASVAPPAGRQWSEVVERTAEGGYRMGNPDAPIKLIESGSRSSSHCAAFAAQGEPILRAKSVETGKVSYEFRDMLRNAPDVVAMLLGECAGPDQFFPILAEMFAAQKDLLGRVQPEFLAPPPGMSVGEHAELVARNMGYIDFIARRGVSDAAARKCLSDSEKIKAVEERLEKAQAQYKIELTPSFIVNGNTVEAGNWRQLEPRLKEAGA